MVPHLALDQDMVVVGRHPDPVPSLAVPGLGDTEEIVAHTTQNT